MSAFNFFDRIVCLTTVPEEWRQAEAEFARMGLDCVQKFQSLPDIGPHQSFSKSLRQILIDFYESKSETLLHLEDDVSFRDLGHLESGLSELPADWDVCYLGANLLLWGGGAEIPPAKFSEHLFRIHGAWTSHAIAFSRRPVAFLLENQPGYSAQMFDQFLSDQLRNLNAYIVAPMVAYQRHHPSAIWGTAEDYTPIFEASDAKLQ